MASCQWSSSLGVIPSMYKLEKKKNILILKHTKLFLRTFCICVRSWEFSTSYFQSLEYVWSGGRCSTLPPSLSPPSPGTYFFTWSLVMGLNSRAIVQLYVNGSPTGAGSYTRTGSQSCRVLPAWPLLYNPDSDIDSMTGSVVLQLTQGQEVTLRKTSGEPDGVAYHSFSGFLVTWSHSGWQFWRNLWLFYVWLTWLPAAGSNCTLI